MTLLKSARIARLGAATAVAASLLNAALRIPIGLYKPWIKVSTQGLLVLIVVLRAVDLARGIVPSKGETGIGRCPGIPFLSALLAGAVGVLLAGLYFVPWWIFIDTWNVVRLSAGLLVAATVMEVLVVAWSTIGVPWRGEGSGR